jgi:hypothetical protein
MKTKTFCIVLSLLIGLNIFGQKKKVVSKTKVETKSKVEVQTSNSFLLKDMDEIVRSLGSKLENSGYSISKIDDDKDYRHDKNKIKTNQKHYHF